MQRDKAGEILAACGLTSTSDTRRQQALMWKNRERTIWSHLTTPGRDRWKLGPVGRKVLPRGVKWWLTVGPIANRMIILTRKKKRMIILMVAKRQDILVQTFQRYVPTTRDFYCK